LVAKTHPGEFDAEAEREILNLTSITWSWLGHS